MTLDQLSQVAIGKAIIVHKRLGPGLLESVYETCLAWELEEAGLKVERQKPLPVVYNDMKLDGGYRVDLLVDRRLLIEIKSVEGIHDIHIAQVLTYLKLGQLHLGLIINFNVALLRSGIRRLVHGEDNS